MGEPRRGALPTALRTVGTLALLQAVLPLNLAVTAVAALKAVLVPAPQEIAQRPRTILVSGGKMTKALLLARAFHRAGHRVVLVESSPYRLTGHRFSRAVARFRVVPRPDSPHYVDALLQVVREEGVDVYVPVCSPVASYHDALAKRALAAYCEVLHPDPELVARLDDKHRFAELAASLGLPVPDAHRISEPGQAVNGHLWLFLASMTDVAYTLTAVDRRVPGCALSASGCPTKTYTGTAGKNANLIDLNLF